MDFKNKSLKSIFPFLLLGILLIGLLFWKFTSRADLPDLEINETQNSVQSTFPAPPIASEPVPGTSNEEDAAIQEQFDRDRRQQRQTKELKIKLEQTNIELEQEKALAEIDKLKKENMEVLNEPTVDGQNNIPDIKVDYIGGGSSKKEAILSIGGTSYQVRERSMPLENIRVLSISDTSVMLHFSSPQELDKTIEYKPE